MMQNEPGISQFAPRSTQISSFSIFPRFANKKPVFCILKADLFFDFPYFFEDKKQSKLLIEALSADKIKAIDHPIKATFNGPLTPFFVRRNEVMIRIE